MTAEMLWIPWFMEKAQFHTLVVLQVKVLYCLFAALGLSVIAVLDLIESTNVYAAVAAGFSVLLLLYAVYLLMRGHKRASPYPEWALVFLLCLFTLFGMQQSDQATHWIYFVPGYVYFLMIFQEGFIIGVSSEKCFYKVHWIFA